MTSGPTKSRFALLDAFEQAFAGHKYRHRSNEVGNRIVDFLYEDVLVFGGSEKFIARVGNRSRVLNPKNVSPGIKARRGDGSFGLLVPGTSAKAAEGYGVARGLTASVEIGAEIKIFAKSMAKQYDRVVSVAKGQAVHFKEKSDRAITVGFIGVNHATSYLSFEGDRSYLTGPSTKTPHPSQEAAGTVARLRIDAAPHFDELLILRFLATNQPPYPFGWVDTPQTLAEYGALIARVGALYEQRF